MDFISDDKPVVDAIYYDDLNGENEVRLGTRRTPQPGRCAFFDGTNYVKFNLSPFPSRQIMVVYYVFIPTPVASVEYLWRLDNDCRMFVYKASNNLRCYWGTSFTEVNIGTSYYNKWVKITYITSSALRVFAIDDVRLIEETNTISFSSVNWISTMGTSYIGSNDVTNKGKSRASNYRVYNTINTDAIEGDKFLTFNTGLVVNYKLDEGAGEIVYDSSGNGKNGDWTGLVASSHYTGSDVPYSYQNEVGYSLNGSVLVPRNEANTTKDVLGNDLTFRGKAPVNLALKGSHCGYFNGTHRVNSTITRTQFPNGSIIVKARFNPDTTNGAFEVLNLGDGATSQVAMSVSWGRFYLWTAVGNILETTPVPAAGNEVDVVFVVEWVDATLTKLRWYKDGVFILEKNLGNSGILSRHFSTINIGNTANNGNLFRGKIYDVQVAPYSVNNEQNAIKGSPMANYIWNSPLSEGGGTTIHNIAGTTHGTLTGDATVFWSKTQDVFHHNLTKGFNGGGNIPLSNFNTNATGTGTWQYSAENQTLVGSSPANMISDFHFRLLPTNPFYRLGAMYRLTLFINDVTYNDGTSQDYVVVFVNGRNTIIRLNAPKRGAVSAVWTFNNVESGDSALGIVFGWEWNAVKSMDIRDIKVELLNKIPAKNATQDALGNTLSNPATKGYNMAETAIDFSGGVASPLASRVPTNWKGEADTSFIHSRRTSTKIDRILVNSTAPTGQQLLRQQRYTGKI